MNMAKANEDTYPDGSYKYFWTPTSDIPLDDFLSKYKPSMVENDGTKPWIWVSKGGKTSSSVTAVDELTALEESSQILKDITNQIENIKNDSSIPLRSNKKTGAKSKKEVREELQRDAQGKFREIAQKHNYLCGKWLMFASGEKVDLIWSSLATSLISGPLASTDAFCAKVATTPRNANPNHQHVLCLYLPDVYDKNAVLKVMKILLRNHGFSLSGVKSDLYTLLGIDSKHPSGIPSTIWKNKDLMDDTEMKTLKDAYFVDLKEGKTANAQSTSQIDDASDKKPADVLTLPINKSKPKKKQKDIFASDDEEDDEEQQRRAELAQKKKATATSTKRSNTSDEDSEHEQEKPKRKASRRA